MIGKAVLASAILSWYFCPRFPVQNVRPTFQLSTDETAQARQAAHSLQGAEDRATRGGMEWRTFYIVPQSWDRGLAFTPDFRFAVAR
jgi:hypothetical protein